MDSEFEQRLDTIMHDVIQEFEQIGLYAMTSGMGLVPSNILTPEAFEALAADESTNIAEQLEAGNVEAMMMFSFRIGDLAWSDRILDPDGFQARRDFEKIMPDESEINVISVAEDILNEDWSVFDKDDKDKDS